MNKEKYMKIAINEAKKAYKKGEVPVGAVIVKNDEIISKAYNLRETKKNSLCHAEILAINKACKKMNNFRLEDCEMYVTLEPCVMCAGAIVQARIKQVYVGALDPKYGAVCSQANIFELPSNTEVKYIAGLLEKECSDIIKKFFLNLRKNKKI